MEAIVARIKTSLENDVFIPLYPKALIDQKTSNSSLFFHRQFWSCVKLFSNILKWRNILHLRILKEFSLDCLLNRYLMIGLQSMEPDMKTLEIIDYLINLLPSEWLEMRTDSVKLPQLVNISRIIRRIADNLNQKMLETKLLDKKTFR